MPGKGWTTSEWKVDTTSSHVTQTALSALNVESKTAVVTWFMHIEHHSLILSELFGEGD